MQMDALPCDRVEGKMDIRLKYGLPGRERFELSFKADLDVLMQPFGLVTTIHTKWC
jgi:hypothetical protein